MVCAGAFSLFYSFLFFSFFWGGRFVSGFFIMKEQRREAMRKRLKFYWIKVKIGVELVIIDGLA